MFGIFDVVADAFGILWEYPVASLLCFMIIALAVIYYYSENGIESALRSMWRVFGFFFEVPHTFMRNSIKRFESSRHQEQIYERTYQRVLHKANQLLFLFSFSVGILILTTGLALALIALYPSDEIALRNSIQKDLFEAQTELEQARTKIAQLTSPQVAENLKKRYDEAQNLVNTSNKNYEDFISNQLGYQGGIIAEIQKRKLSLPREIRDDSSFPAYLEEAMTGCPEDSLNWPNFNAVSCADFRAQARRLREFRVAYLNAEEALETAEKDRRNTPRAINEARSEAETLTKVVSRLTRNYEEAKLSNMHWVKDSVVDALVLFFTALGEFIFFIWIMAIIAYLMSWAVHVMRWIEEKADE